MQNSYLSSNIKALRLLHRESQDTLAEVLGLRSKSSISDYENGRTVIDDETIQKIADYYSVSVEDLINSDLSRFANYELNVPLGFVCADKVFPLLDSKNNQKNTLFNKAYNYHHTFIQKLQKNDPSTMNCVDDIERCYELYIRAIEEEESQEAIVNLISLHLLQFFLLESIGCFTKETAVFEKIKKQSTRKIEIPQYNDSELEDLQCLKKNYYDDSCEWLYEKLNNICHSDRYSDIGYYYLALCYWVNFTDNQKGLIWNRSIAFEMMDMLSKTGNGFARDMLIAVIYNNFIPKVR